MCVRISGNISVTRASDARVAVTAVGARDLHLDGSRLRRCEMRRSKNVDETSIPAASAAIKKGVSLRCTLATASPVAVMGNDTGSAVLMPLCGRAYWSVALTLFCTQ